MMKEIAAGCLGLSVLAFAFHAYGKTLFKGNLAFIGVALLVAGVYFVPVLFVAAK